MVSSTISRISIGIIYSLKLWVCQSMSLKQDGPDVLGNIHFTHTLLKGGCPVNPILRQIWGGAQNSYSSM